ncbi:MAG: GTPase family protein [Bacteroidia bacterium]
MSFFDLIKGLLKDSNISEELKTKIAKQVSDLTKMELENPPKIGIIGLTGVGKSTTINSLFGTKLKSDASVACTQIAEPIILQGPKGKIVVFDMPGLGEDIEKDEIHKQTYAKVLPECDVIIWVMVANAPGRAMAYDQMMLRDVVGAYVDKLVIGLNQVDLIDPNDWIDAANIPSKQQYENLERRIVDVREKIGKIVPNLTKERILYYSAIKRYRLEELFQCLVDACANNRGWVLDSRQSIADYKELIEDKELLKKLEEKN